MVPEIASAIPASTWAQFGLVIIILGFIALFGKGVWKAVKEGLEAFDRYRIEQKQEMETQRKWSEDMGIKRDEFQEKLQAKNKDWQEQYTIRQNEFMQRMFMDQQKGVEVLNQNVQLIHQKQDILLTSMLDHNRMVMDFKAENMKLHDVKKDKE